MTRSTGRSGASSPSIHRRHSRRACGHGLRTSRRRPCGGPTGSGRRSGRRRRWCSPWPCSGRRRRTRRSSRPPWSPRPGTQRLRRPAPYACGRNGPPPIDRSRSPPSRLSRPEGGSPAHFRQRQRPGPHGSRGWCSRRASWERSASSSRWPAISRSSSPCRQERALLSPPGIRRPSSSFPLSRPEGGGAVLSRPAARLKMKHGPFGAPTPAPQSSAAAGPAHGSRRPWCSLRLRLGEAGSASHTAARFSGGVLTGPRSAPIVTPNPYRVGANVSRCDSPCRPPPLRPPRPPAAPFNLFGRRSASPAAWPYRRCTRHRDDGARVHCSAL